MVNKNQPVDVMASFTDQGIKPLKYRLRDKIFEVDRILEKYMENFAGNRRLVFSCEDAGGFKVDLKYELDTKVWYLFS